MSSPEQDDRERSRRAVAVRRLGVLAGMVGLAFGVVALAVPHAAQSLRDAFEPLGVGAPFAFVAAATVLTCTLFPYPLLAAAAGLVFGTALGTVVSIVAGTTGAPAAFLIARAGGAGAVVGAGLTPVGVVPYAVATLIGIAPRAFAYSALGSSFRVTELTSPEAIIAVAVLAAMALLGLALIALELRRHGAR